MATAAAPQTASTPAPTPERASTPITTVAPPVDVFTNDHGTLLVADLPGVATDAVTLKVDGRKRELTLRALRDRSGGETLAYERRFKLGRTVDTEGISASLKDGVLTLELPRAEAHRPREIAVRAG